MNSKVNTNYETTNSFIEKTNKEGLEFKFAKLLFRSIKVADVYIGFFTLEFVLFIILLFNELRDWVLTLVLVLIIVFAVVLIGLGIAMLILSMQLLKYDRQFSSCFIAFIVGLIIGFPTYIWCNILIRKCRHTLRMANIYKLSDWNKNQLNQPVYFQNQPNPYISKQDKTKYPKQNIYNPNSKEAVNNLESSNQNSINEKQVESKETSKK